MIADTPENFMSNIKIIISYHKKCEPIISNIFLPMQVGCALTSERFANMLHDDDGDNISDRNRKYSELTAQYWTWKNYDKIGNPDYVGFMHYRRHFLFDGWKGNPRDVWLPHGAFYKFPCMGSRYLKHLASKHVEMQLKEADVLTIKAYDVRYLNSRDLRTQYATLPKQKVEYFDILIRIAKELAPDYLYEIEMIEHGSIQILCNMFVMPKVLFFEYSRFLFPILDEIDSLIDSSDNNTHSLRHIGYLAEFLLSVFIFHIHRQGKYKIKELCASYILNPDKILLHPRLDCFKYYTLGKICRGERGEKYQEECESMKKLLRQARAMNISV